MALPTDLLSTLEAVTVEAGRLAQSLRRNMEVSHKPDGSLVTSADRDVEVMLREHLPGIIAETGIWGEEFGFEEPGPNGTWLVDPIDGTSNFVFGQPLWGVTIAHMAGGRLTAGSVAMPDLGWSFVAVEGQGAFKNGERLATVKCGPIERFELVGQADDGSEAFDFLPGKRRHLGAFVAEAMFMATGGMRAMTATKASLYDAAGSLVVLREAGAEVRNADGSAFDESKWLAPGRVDPFVILPPGAWPLSS
ncbi:MAG: hypothetical protein JSS66_14665 [Armatimonadetes bacterium]|nr:hypothetical protein [Armatimonadota bacterium]